MKRCSGCGNEFPLDAFQVKRSNPDGTVRERHTRCPICRAEQALASRQRRAERASSQIAVVAEPTTWLDIGPFRAWLLDQLERDGIDIMTLAERIGHGDRQVRRWLSDARTVSLDMVDAALCRVRDVGALAELYPELYEFDDVRAAA
jgi:hypothetical protein